MQQPDTFWDLYWDTRLQFLQGQGKGQAITAASKWIRQLATLPDQNIKVLELGCGEGHILGSLAAAHNDINGISDSIGVDYDPQALQNARRDYPGIQFMSGDFTDPQFLSQLGKFEIVLLVNALHHVYSDAYNEELGEVDVPIGKQAVITAFEQIMQCVQPGGYLLLFDGVEAAGNVNQPVEIQFLHEQARDNFYQFAREYQPFRIRYMTLPQEDCIQLSLRDFTRYITKMIFLGKPLWERERLESYQYFNLLEFRELFDSHHLTIKEWQVISVDDQRWQDAVEILTPGIDFPTEHVLIVAQKQNHLG